MDKKAKIIIFLFIAILAFSVLIRYFGNTDLNDYAGVAKYFSGDYHAKIRSSHSLIYGMIISPFLQFFPGFTIMKLFSFFFLLLIIISLYYMTNSKKTLLLFLLSPITWYSAPVISPIIISSLFFLWGYFFRKSRVILSGILIGISIALWNSVIFILFFMLLCFFYDKKFYELLIFLLAVFIGFLPLVLLDYFLYGIPFYSLLKFIFGTVVIFTSGSIYGGAKQAAGTFLDYIYFIAFLPAFAFVFFKKNIFEKNKREIIFISITILFFFLNPQIRYLFFLWPIIIILLSDSLNDKQFKIQSIIFSAITIIVIILYIFTSVPSYSLKASMNKIAEQYPNESFIVGNNYDDYTLLALAYWGNDVKEFISIQDYEMYLENSTILYEKKIISTPKIQERRRIWVGGGLLAAEDNIDYDSVNFVLGIGEPVAIENFTFIKNYGEIYLSKRK